METQDRALLTFQLERGHVATERVGKRLAFPEMQKSVCTRFAESRGWKIVATYADDAVSGAIYERPGLIELLAAVKSKDRAFDVVVVSALDRIGRGEMIETLTVLARSRRPACGSSARTTGRRSRTTTTCPGCAR